MREVFRGTDFSFQVFYGDLDFMTSEEIKENGSAS